MDPTDFPLIGLLAEILLPGEERAFGPTVVDEATRAMLRACPPSTSVCAVSIAVRAELPSLVAARWATEAEVVSVSETDLVLRGERRVRILSVRGFESPFHAEIEPSADRPADASTADAEGTALLAGLSALAVALSADPAPSVVEVRAERIRRAGDAGRTLLRAALPPARLPEALRLPLSQALEAAARTLLAAAPGEAASKKLEEMTREIAGKAELSPALRQRLWSQIAEIQRRLDLADPKAADDPDDGLAGVQRRLMQAGLPRAARQSAKRELRLLRDMPTNHHDYSSFFAHLDLMARLSWHADPEPPLDLDRLARALDAQHVGLDRPKRRMAEFLAVRALGGRTRSTVLCLAGPPGVGKTTLAEAIATALGRKYVRIPLGGVHDECEIRGHRQSFLAAGPGRIIAGMATAGSASPVVLLDEIDKMGKDQMRSPFAALLEVLDPAQNTHFQDNYLAVPYDLSQVLFLCTVNELGDVHPTLRDRLEPIELDGYSYQEKIAIARGRLLARLAEEHGLPNPLEIDAQALDLVIEGHTREAGIRQLHRALAAIHRARAMAVVRGGGSAAGSSTNPSAGADGTVATAPSRPTAPITVTEAAEVLGPPRWTRKAAPAALPPGVATGLSVGPEGGSLVFVEVGRMPGKGEVRMTGRLGDVMRESALTALARLRMDPGRHGITAGNLAGDFHVHVPEAATAKDGPSAGVAIFAAFLSAASGKAVRPDTAMTGEITLTGDVLPVGGVRAKALAAERAGMRRLVLPRGNLADIPAGLAVEIFPVETLAEAVAAVFPAVPVGSARRARATCPPGRGNRPAKHTPPPAPPPPA